METAGLVLRAEGYYDALVRYRVERGEPGKRPTVVISIDAGPVYLLASYDVEVVEGDAEQAVALFEGALGEGWRGAPATANRVESLEAAVVAALLDSSYALAEVADRRVVVDHKERVVRVTLAVDIGAAMEFGHVRVVGLDKVPEHYVRRRVPWSIGDPYDASQLVELRTRLVSTGLFGSVRVRPLPELASAGRLPVELDLSEAKVRQIGLGVRYDSDDGIGGQGWWENRNFRGEAETLRVTVLGSQREVGGSLSYRRPDFLTIGQALTGNTSLSSQDTDAFNANKLAFSIGVERPLTPRTVLDVGVGYEYGPVDGIVGVVDGVDDSGPALIGVNQSRTFSLLSLPLAWRRDSSNRLLDPSRGSRTLVEVIPYLGPSDDVTFGLGRVVYRAYVPVGRRDDLVVAGRVGVGSIVGESLFDLPADKRFYAGGGGSVRGYKFQFAGPLTATNDPIGGRSLVEVGGELRWRVKGNFGLVPFIDGGTVYTDSVPSFDDRLFWGAGLGLRYFSVAGPLRLDVATPLNGRSGIDDVIQFYISLGQAF